MAVFQHPDMPKAIAGIPGLNHWNFLFMNVLMSWLINRKKDYLEWDMPSHFNFLLFFYSLFIVVSVIRYLNDYSGLIELALVFDLSVYTGIIAINEYLINSFKWVIPAIIIFDGCRTRKQYNFAVVMLALMYVLLALQVIKAMKFGSLGIGGEELQRRALKVISRNVGYHRVNMSMMMSGAFWMVFCLKEFVSNKTHIYIIIPSCISILFAMVMTGGRAGYITWVFLGIIYCVFKWRKYLWFTPLVVVLVLVFASSAVERLTQGLILEPDLEIITQEVDFDQEKVDLHSITSGRVIAWPLVWQSIMEAPFFGYGREAMKNTGLTLQILEDHGKGETFPHPHNLYLQWLQDNGFIGAIPVFLFFILILKNSWNLYRDNSERIYVVAGGMSLALSLAFLIAGLGSQTFYPREGAVGMWVAMLLMLRVRLEREKVKSKKESALIHPTKVPKSKYFIFK